MVRLQGLLHANLPGGKLCLCMCIVPGLTIQDSAAFCGCYYGILAYLPALASYAVASCHFRGSRGCSDVVYCSGA